MTSQQIRQKYIDFFKARGHVALASASILPENDPTTLFTGSGMQPMVPYLLGEKHPEGTRLANSQKSFRTEDIEEVGDNRHNTFFEMLGNWSLGDYFKQEQIEWMFEFLTKEVNIDPQKLYVTVFRGNDSIGIEKDTEAVDIWKQEFKKIGIEAQDIDLAEENGMQNGRIFYYNEAKNWWSRAGVPSNMPVGEPGGPDSEIFYDLGADLKYHENSEFKNQHCHVNCDCGRFIEIGNNVFMAYKKTDAGFVELDQKNIDFGGGLERITMAVQGKNNIFDTDLFTNIIQKIEELSGKQYADNRKAFEVIADHIKASTFIIGDDRGVVPSNTDQGYIVRRLIRRAIRFGRQLEININDRRDESLPRLSWTKEIANVVINDYKEVYNELERNANKIILEFTKEEEKFSKALDNGLKKLQKIIDNKDDNKLINGEEAFQLFATHGFPIEMTQELASEKNLKIDIEGFEKEMKKHEELSRTSSAGKFKGGLEDASIETTKLHTAAHLMLASLRKVLGDHVAQKGSNITAERLRFDFSHPEKLTDEQKQEVEKLVNNAIEANANVTCNEMSVDEAKAQGAIGIFESKYGEKVKVFTIQKDDVVFSKEICGGPHVEITSELGKFKIKKEQSSSSGVRRIKATLS